MVAFLTSLVATIAITAGVMLYGRRRPVGAPLTWGEAGWESLDASSAQSAYANIAGLPTWFTIRANHRGYVSRKKEIDFLVAMNPETAKEDVLALGAGAAVVYDEPLKLNALRQDL